MKPTKLGTTGFLKRVRISAPQMRGLEAAGVINPTRADSGWRQFSQEDVEAAMAWKLSRRVEAQERKAQRAVAAS